jgi:hypothetical protein
VGTVTRLPIGRRARAALGGARPAPLRLTLRAGDPAVDGPLGIASLEVRATGGRAPVQLTLAVNGELARSWTSSRGQFDLSLDEYGPGRHVVTVRAVDGLGRRATASVVIVALALEPSDALAQPPGASLTAGPGPA